MRIKSLAIAATTALLVPLLGWAGPTVSILPAVQSVAQGGQVTVTVAISGLLGIPDQLSAYDLRVTYDPARLTFGSEALLAEPYMGSVVLFELLELFDSSTAGVASDQVDSLLGQADLANLQAGVDGFDLFSLTFTAANVDAATNLGFQVVNDTNGGPISPIVVGNNGGNALAAQYVGACIGIGAGVCGQQPIPEPATYALTGIALLAAVFARRQRKTAIERAAA